MGNEKLTTTESAGAQVNLTQLKGTYEVTAKDGIRLDGHEETIEKGATVELGADAARALLNEGSIKEASK
jgi:hypothetical protein